MQPSLDRSGLLASSSPRCQVAGLPSYIRTRQKPWRSVVCNATEQICKLVPSSSSCGPKPHVLGRQIYKSLQAKRGRPCFSLRPEGQWDGHPKPLNKRKEHADKSSSLTVDALSTTSHGFEAEGEALLEETSAQLLDGLSGWRKRWTIVGLCFVAFVLCNLDRVNMSVAILPMAAQYGWGAATMGLVQSSFFWGYLLTQVAGGVWADRVGGKTVLGAGVLWWSVATALTPVAASMGLPALLVARCLMGVGEGVAMPAMNNMLSKWVPAPERSRSLALVYSGMFTGSILGLGLSPQIVQSYGWPSVFYSFGSLGIIWALVWRRQAASTPAEDASLSTEERAYILANTPASSQERAGDIPWRALLSRKEVWAIIVCHFCHNWGLFILLTWMPAYYNQVLGLDLAASGGLSVLPWAAMALMANVAGWLADYLVARGVSITTVRKTMQTIGFLGPAFFLSQLGGISSAPAAVLCMVGSQGLDAFSQSGLYANHQDIGPRYAGVLLGLSNTAGVLAGVLGSLVTGYLLQSGSWDMVWHTAVGFYLVGTAVWLAFSTGEKVFD